MKRDFIFEAGKPIPRQRPAKRGGPHNLVGLTQCLRRLKAGESVRFKYTGVDKNKNVWLATLSLVSRMNKHAHPREFVARKTTHFITIWHVSPGWEEPKGENKNG